MNRICSIFVALLLSPFGCASVDTSSGAGDSTLDEEEALSTGQGYLVVTRADFRKCMSPICGGYFVKRVNATRTRCMDGSLRPECYIAEMHLDFPLSGDETSDFLGMFHNGQAIVRGAWAKNALAPQISDLRVSEAWLGATKSTPNGTYFRAADNGIRCIKAPCPTTTASSLNGSTSKNVVAVDLEHTARKATPSALSAASEDLGTKTGILVAGNITTPACKPGSNCGPTLHATEFYLRLEHVSAIGQSCGSRGLLPCSAGQYCSWPTAAICGQADAPGKCAARAEMCPMVEKPVCGCDGETYSNSCIASSYGVSVARSGACK